VYIQYTLGVLAALVFWVAGTYSSSAADTTFPLEEVADDMMHIVAQVVLKRADGMSILDAKTPLTSKNIRKYSVEHNRIEESKKRLEELGFAISSQDHVTLSIMGSAKLFTEVFGIEDPIASSTSDIHATIIPPGLRNFIADVFIPKPPEFF
jgi:hypothetical protein